MQRLIALVARTLGREWIDIGEYLRGLDDNSLAAIEARLMARDFAGLIQQVDEAARMFATATNTAQTRAGQAGAKWLDSQPELKDVLVHYDAANDRAVRAARQNKLQWVRGLAEEQRESVRQALVEGQRLGLNPRRIAVDIRDSVTLTPQQAKHVASYRRALEQGDYGNALGRQLRDARSDPRLRRLQDKGGSLTESQIDSMVERYRRGQIAHRAEMIARTESAKNVAAGLTEAYRQAVESGAIEAGQLVKEWIPGPPTKDARPEHRTHDLRAQRPKLNEAFVLADGTRMQYPGDPNAPARHLVACRCTWSTTLA